ncbi:MAG: DUF4019 domain-containing protein [Rhizomicrobium sp.]
MTRPAAAALAVWLLIPSLAGAATDDPGSSAREWVALIDQQKYVESWQEGSAFFRSRVTTAAWQHTTKLYRDPVGKLLWREVDSVALVAKLRDLPDGQYAVVRFHSKFAQLPDSIETIEMIQEGGLWRVSSYSIH